VGASVTYNETVEHIEQLLKTAKANAVWTTDEAVNRLAE